jgi:hypothetical protein
VGTTKNVRLVLTRPRKEIPVAISPEDTASTALQKAGLDPNDYYVLKPSDQTEFGMAEPIFNHVEEGGKLHATPQSNVGMRR